MRHLSRYTYPEPVLASFNEVRLTPLRTQWQTPLEAVLHVSEATWQFQYDDYWGTHVRVFESQHQHRVLTVDATSLVEVDNARRPRAQLSTSFVRYDDCPGRRPLRRILDANAQQRAGA